MSLRSDLRILYYLLLKPVRGKDHAARMESFYAGQAEAYDDFRKRLLQGRQRLWNAMEVPSGGIWVDMGGGTGSTVEFFSDSLSTLKKVYIVDISRSLLRIARTRIERNGWSNVEAVEADAATFRPPERACDVVTYSYSLSMIPDWFAALENAQSMLGPNGQIGVVDFYVSCKHPNPGAVRHRWLTRNMWPVLLSMDNVFPSPDHAPYLHQHFDPMHFTESRARLPYLPLARVPYYTFVGRKRSQGGVVSELNSSTTENA